MSAADREKWDSRYRTDGADERGPSAFLTALGPLLPRRGQALDVAGGAGRNAIWLAHRGLDVTVVDISTAGLELARLEAAAAGVALELRCADLESELLPEGPWILVVCFNFLRREIFARFADALVAGGLLVYGQPTRRNLERHARPPAAFLLEDGELPGLVTGLEIVSYEEGWFDHRHEARLLARKPPSPGPSPVIPPGRPGR